MSSAVLRIQVATLSDVPDGESRIDGVPEEVVTVRSVGAGSTHELRFWDVCNPGVDGATVYDPAVPEITETGDGRSWTFTPPGDDASFGQSFGLELIVDRGLSTQVRARRIYAIPTETLQHVLPIFGEGADPQASLVNNGATQIGNSADNHDQNWRGYHPKLVEWLLEVESAAGGGGGGGDTSPLFHVCPFPDRYTVAAQLELVNLSDEEVLIGTVFLPAGEITQVVADYGEAVNPYDKEAKLILRKQSDASAIFTVMRTATRAMATHALSVVIVAGAYELFAKSTLTSGSWICKGVEITVETA